MRSDLLLLLSGEETSLPEAEARTLVSSYDPGSRFEKLGGKVLLARTSADVDLLAARIAFARRVGTLIPDGELADEHLRLLSGHTYRVRVVGSGAAGDRRRVIDRVASQIDSRVSLENPDFEITVVLGDTDRYALTRPGLMRQAWVTRRPRARAYFHPSAIFPKLSRAIVNLSGIRQGETLLDPFCGTGSLLIEASQIGAIPVGIDLAEKMVRGSLRNMKKLRQEWGMVARADSRLIPLARVDAIATDVPYGRASSTAGSSTEEIVGRLLASAHSLLSLGSRMVLMHPQTVVVRERGLFSTEQAHHIYIHRRLTRVITVLRRV